MPRHRHDQPRFPSRLRHQPEALPPGAARAAGPAPAARLARNAGGARRRDGLRGPGPFHPRHRCPDGPDTEAALGL